MSAGGAAAFLLPGVGGRQEGAVVRQRRNRRHVYDAGLVSGMTTWDVYLKGGAISEVTAEKVKTSRDPILGEKVVQFWTGNILVAQWPEFEIVKYEVTS